MNCSGQSNFRIAHRDRFSEVGAQQIPGRLPAVTLDQTAQGQDGLSTGDSPSHAGLLQTLGDERFAGCFDHTAGNGQSLADVLGIVHALSLIAKVSQLGFQSFPFSSSGSPVMVSQDPNDPLSALVIFLEQYFQALKLSLTAGRALTPGSITTFFQMVAGVVEIHNFDTGLGWWTAGLVNFFR